MNAISYLAQILRSLQRLPGRVRMLRSASWLLGQSTAEFPLGGFRLLLEIEDPFQAAMAVDLCEPDVISLMSRILRPGDTYVDVGAQLGYTSAHAAELLRGRGKLLLFEPDPHAHKRLVQSLPQNISDEQFTICVFNEACSDERGHVRMQLSSIVGQTTSMDIKLIAGTRGIINASSTTLDQTLDSNAIEHVRLLKMDIEGHELFALRGLKQSLKTRAIDFILIEKNNHALDYHGFRAEHLHGFLAQNGYCGAHTDGRRITSDSINQHPLENLVYANSETALHEIFYGRITSSQGHDFTPMEIANWHDTIIDDGAFQAVRIIALMQRGCAREALTQAESFFQSHEGYPWFRGHYAHWLQTLGEQKKAEIEYRQILTDDPQNEEIRIRIAELRQGSTPPR